MGSFSLLMVEATGPGWRPALGWNIIPAGIGNIISGTAFVALPFWYVSSSVTPTAASRRPR